MTHSGNLASLSWRRLREADKVEGLEQPRFDPLFALVGFNYDPEGSTVDESAQEIFP